MDKVAFLGLGAMGSPMAVRLSRQFAVTVYNRTPRNIPDTVVSRSPRECVQGARFIVTMLTDEHALDAVLSGPDGILMGLERNAVLIDMATSGRRAAIAAAKRVEAAGGRFIDAPVSGTVGPAARGELVAFAGGRLEDLSDASKVLQAMCKRILHVGGVGQGQAMKVVLNGLGAHHLVAFASMLALAQRAGITRAMALEAITQSAFATPSYIGKKSKVLARDWSAEFSLDLTQKDARLNGELQEDVGMQLPVFQEIQRAIEKSIDAGLGDLDLFAIEKIYE
jgi:3-hydroxyisobutyrate dehydrogenase-like beta-hydroxyacid dehydrogenase